MIAHQLDLGVDDAMLVGKKGGSLRTNDEQYLSMSFRARIRRASSYQDG